MLPNNAKEFYYVYSVEALAVANAASVTRIINIQADSNFLVQQLNFAAVNDGAATRVTHPDALVQITDTSSGMTLFDRPLPIWMIAGTAELPFILPTPRIFLASSALNVNITNNNGGALDFWLAFHGRKYALGIR